MTKIHLAKEVIVLYFYLDEEEQVYLSISQLCLTLKSTDVKKVKYCSWKDAT